MKKREAAKYVRKVRQSIKAKQIVEKLQDDLLNAPVILPHHIQIGRLLLDHALKDDGGVVMNQNIVIEVEFQDVTQTPAIEGLATEVHREPQAVQHSSDSPEGGQDVPSDLLAAADGADVQKT